MNRVCFAAKKFPTHYASETAENYVEAPQDRAQLVSSLLPDGRHAPTLDIDMPISVIPSSTPGHFHLFIDHPMSWRCYRRLLRALCRAGVIERGFYKASVRRQRTQLRLPSFPKGEEGAVSASDD